MHAKGGQSEPWKRKEGREDYYALRNVRTKPVIKKKNKIRGNGKIKINKRYEICRAVLYFRVFISYCGTSVRNDEILLRRVILIC